MKKLRKNYGKILWACLLAMIIAANPLSVPAVGGRTDMQTTDFRAMSGWPSGPELNARSAYLIELNSGTVLFGKNEDETRYPASITKVMTALIVIENCQLDELVTFSHNAVTDIEEGGNSWEYKEGEVLTVEQCLYALLLDSVNEAGYALAEHVAGSVEAFAQMMNDRAAELGCTNTNFTNPHGLNDENHTTTAKDMALIFWAALQNETFYTIDSTLNYTIPPTELNPTGENFSFDMHHNMMLPSGEHYYDGVKAGKTGYTSIAMNTLVTYAERDGIELVCVVMKAGGNGTVYEDTKKLLDYGFENFQLVDMTNEGQNFCHGLNTAYPMPLEMDGDSVMLIPRSVSSLTMEFAPKTGDDDEGVVGHLLFRNADQIMGSNTIRVAEMDNSQTTPITAVSQTGEAAGDGEIVVPDEQIISGAEAESSEDSKVSEDSEDELTVQEENEDEGKPFWFWVLMIILVPIGGVFIYWAVIQVIKYRRRQRRRRLRQMRRRRRY